MPNQQPCVKDAFHDAVISQDFSSVSPDHHGTKCAPVYKKHLVFDEEVAIKVRISQKKLDPATALGSEFDEIFSTRIQEADEFYQTFQKADNEDLANIQRQAFAGMLWSKQYFHIDIPRWLEGDPGNPEPPKSRYSGRNHDWMHLNNEDIISMPDKWEYPWYAAWDLAFHCVPLAMVDAEFSKNQLLLFLREWYMHPNGQIPAYEWSFSDVNPPVHAWACLQVYKD